MALSITTLNIKIQGYYSVKHYVAVMLSVVMLSFIMLTVDMHSVTLLNVVAPKMSINITE